MHRRPLSGTLNLFITIVCIYSTGILTGQVIYGHNRRILPADSYQILGKTGVRRLGQCNISYAWLVPPPTSSLDAYGHALACTRLQLQNGHVVRSALNGNEEEENQGNRPEEELKRINKELTTTMIDLNRLDALLRADKAEDGRIITGVAAQLADESRYFYLADRVGDLNVMVLLRPGQQLKLELIDPISPDHLVTPQHVLCSRKECPITPNPTESISESTDDPQLLKVLNTSRILTASLSKAERQNRELYMQLIISRVACALLSFLCIVFAIAALTLCIRLRKTPGFYRKKAPPSELSVCRDPHPSPSYFQTNGKINVGQPSPVYFTDTSPRHAGLAHLTGDTASVNNVLMTASNLSDCGAIPGIHGAQISYAALGPQYGHLSGYPISAGRASLYNDSSGVLTFVPVTTRGVIVPYQNGSASPAPSNHSMSETRGVGVVRSGSLGRYSELNVCNSENGRRKFARLNKHPVSLKHIESASSQMHHNPMSLQQNILDGQQMRGFQNPTTTAVDHVPKSPGTPVINDLILFQQADSGNQPKATHRCASAELPLPFPKAYAPCASIDGERTSVNSNHLNHIQESCVTVVRKPALAN
ncbi:hypothetical protein T265_14690, partial [Opisthorchis viverrini]